MNKSLDQKLANILAHPSGAPDFILADAKDADMGAGISATGIDHATGKRRSVSDYRDQMRQIVAQGLVDVMLMSSSSSEQLTIRERIFDQSSVTPAVRANDTFDVHSPRGGLYSTLPSRPFRTATITQIQSGKAFPTDAERKLGADLGLYSITPNNNTELDLVTLEAYKEFRLKAEHSGFRHFLEVFDPNVWKAPPQETGAFVNDFIVRALAGVPSPARPIFLKIAYHGPKLMEELATHDSSLIVGVMGGAGGTTHDAFALLEESQRYGARVALFGRKINFSEHQLTFITHLRAVADRKLSASEACRAYHGELQKMKIKPIRPLEDDLQRTQTF